MNDVEELKRYVVAHARTQNIPHAHYRRLLQRIHTDDDWTREWTEAGQAWERDGKFLDACRYYTIAGFPYVDGDARQSALERSVSAFDTWRRSGTDIQPLDGPIRCWTTGLSTTEPRPLLLVMGGILSTKEQWAPVLLQAKRLGMAGVVAELPGVGENPLRYDVSSWRMLSQVLDELADRADVTQTYALTMSFSGHAALRCAVEDPRIRGIVTAGAPVSEFFTDAAWQRGLPRLTVDTLSHLTGTSDLHDWALTTDQLAALDIPVCSVVSLRDEIIPRGDVRRLAEHVRRSRFLVHHDVHGSPDHVAQSRLWCVLSLLRMRGGHYPQRIAVGSLLRFRRLLDHR